MDEFTLKAQQSFSAVWCNHEFHVELTGARDVHDFRAAGVSLKPCDCTVVQEQPAAV